MSLSNRHALLFCGYLISLQALAPLAARSSSLAEFLVVDFLRNCLLPALFLLYGRLAYGYGLAEYGVVSPSTVGRIWGWLRYPALVVLVWGIDRFAVGFANGVVEEAGLRQVSDGLRQIDYRAYVAHGTTMGLIVALYFSVTAALFEEVFYRAIFWQAAKSCAPQSVGLLYVPLSALIFSLAHWRSGPVIMIETLIIGLLLAALYNRSRDIKPLIAAHFCIDFSWFYLYQ